MAEQLAGPAQLLDRVDLARFHDARGDQRGRVAGGADADHHEIALAGHAEGLGDALLRQQDLAVADAVGHERHRHDIGLRAGPVGDAVDHLVRVGGEAARQTAHQ